MATASVTDWSAQEPIPFLGDSFEPQWYAAYTCANHEKRVTELLRQRSVENFCPWYETVRRWKDRRVRVKLPLFPGYVFVRLALRDRLRVLEAPGVVRLVGCNGRASALPSSEIEILRQGLNDPLRARPHPYLTVGKRVRVKGGPLAGVEGILLRRKGQGRLVLSIELIMRSIIADIDVADVAPQP